MTTNTPTIAKMQTRAIMPLHGHTSVETAYIIQDYPYGFKLRCKMRCWLEFDVNKGFRFCTQTTNPKRPGEVWNTVKKSTYAYVCGVMFADADGKISWDALSEYSGTQDAIAFRDKYQPQDIALDRINYWIKRKQAYDARRAAEANTE